MQYAPLKKKSFSLLETSMIQLLLAAQIIDYQACEIIVSQGVITELSKRRNTIKHWRRESVYHHVKLFIMYLLLQLFQWVCKIWVRKRSRQWKAAWNSFLLGPQRTSLHWLSRPNQTWKVTWCKIYWGIWEWECLQRFYILHLSIFLRKTWKKAKGC